MLIERLPLGGLAGRTVAGNAIIVKKDTIMVTNQKHISATRPLSWLAVMQIAIVILSCTKHTHKNDPKPQEKVFPEIHTGPATFHVLGGVIETFTVNFEKTGNIPIDEYGVVYAFLPETNLVDLVVDGPYPAAKFKGAAKEGLNTETFKIGFPSNMHALSYRAYVKLKGGEVRYADNYFSKEY